MRYDRHDIHILWNRETMYQVRTYKQWIIVPSRYFFSSQDCQLCRQLQWVETIYWLLQQSVYWLTTVHWARCGVSSVVAHRPVRRNAHAYSTSSGFWGLNEPQFLPGTNWNACFLLFVIHEPCLPAVGRDCCATAVVYRSGIHDTAFLSCDGPVITDDNIYQVPGSWLALPLAITAD